MNLTLGFSPCPNDTFIFDALVNKKIDTNGLDFKVMLEDVQTLNTWAQQGKLDVSKISYGVLPLLIDQYKVLNSGGALGKGVGPLVISKADMPDLQENQSSYTFAVPGVNTTAHMLFSMAYPKALNKQFFVFNQIEDAVLNGEVDAGVIIHENRFTYQEKGLVKIIDLGNFWETETMVPIPLGGIVIKKTFDNELMKTVDRLIRKSVEYAFKNYPVLSSYVSMHSQEMDEAVMRKHIDLYVNQYTIDLGLDGKKAVQKLFQVYASLNNQNEVMPNDLFVDSVNQALSNQFS